MRVAYLLRDLAPRATWVHWISLEEDMDPIRPSPSASLIPSPSTAVTVFSVLNLCPDICFCFTEVPGLGCLCHSVKESSYSRSRPELGVEQGRNKVMSWQG